MVYPINKKIPPTEADGILTIIKIGYCLMILIAFADDLSICKK
jgi:hypothetical protein